MSVILTRAFQSLLCFLLFNLALFSVNGQTWVSVEQFGGPGIATQFSRLQFAPNGDMYFAISAQTDTTFVGSLALVPVGFQSSFFVKRSGITNQLVEQHAISPYGGIDPAANDRIYSSQTSSDFDVDNYDATLTSQWNFTTSSGSFSALGANGIRGYADGSCALAGTYNGFTTGINLGGSVTLPANNSTTNSAQDLYIARLDANGDALWAKAAIGSFGGLTDYLFDLELSSTGDIVVGGWSFSDTMKVDTATIGVSATTLQWGYVFQFSENGDLEWAKNVDPQYDRTQILNLDMDAADNIYAAGFQWTTFGINADDTGMVFKLDPNGVEIWQAQITGGSVQVQDIYTTPGGISYVCGNYRDSIHSPQGTLPGFGVNDAFVAKLDVNGVVQWVATAGSNSDDLAYSLTAEPGTDNLYIGGYFSNTATFGGITMVADMGAFFQRDQFLGVIQDPDVGCDSLPSQAMAGGDISACGGTTAQFQAVSATSGTGMWSLLTGSGVITDPFDPTSTVTNLGTGTSQYVWSVTACGISTYDTIEVVQSDGPDEPQITATGPLTFCEGDGVILLATPGFDEYEWSNGAMFSSTTIIAAGTYTVTVSDQFGCTNVSAPITVNVLPAPATPTIIQVPPDSLQSSVTSTMYNWSLNGNPLNDNNQTIHAPLNGAYTLTIIGANGCESAAGSITLSVGIGEKQELAEIKVYPNPAQETVFVAIENGGADLRCVLHNALGQPVEVPARTTGNGFALDVAGLSNGLYYLQVQGSSVQTLPVLIQK